MPGLLRGVVRTAAVAGTASAVSGRVQHRQAQRWQEQAPAEPAYQQAPAPPPAAAPSSIDQLKELAELKSQGILTEDEFAAQKAKILGA